MLAILVGDFNTREFGGTSGQVGDLLGRIDLQRLVGPAEDTCGGCSDGRCGVTNKSGGIVVGRDSSRRRGARQEHLALQECPWRDLGDAGVIDVVADEPPGCDRVELSTSGGGNAVLQDRLQNSAEVTGNETVPPVKELAIPSVRGGRDVPIRAEERDRAGARILPVGVGNVAALETPTAGASRSDVLENPSRL